MTKKITVPIISTVLLMSMIFSPTTFAATGQIGTSATAVGVKYKTHIQDKGWESVWKNDGSLSGTVGESKRLEAMRIELTGSVPAGAEILTYVHVQNEGDLGPFSMGDLAGTEGKGLRMERIKLVLKDLPGYTLKYNVQVQNIGWLKDETDDSTWFVSGDTAGTTGKGYRLEAIRIKLVEVNKYLQFYYEALSSVEQYLYTEESWADYQVVVKANVVTEDSTNTQILAATRAILAAQADLVEGMDFRAYMAAINAVKEVECTPDTWGEYQQVLDENVMTQDNTQAEIDAATAIILKAQKKLQMKVNLTAYLNALESVREADYTTGSWAEYQQVLIDNAMTENNSQTEVDAATERIVNAQKKMVRKFDFTAYDALLAAVKEEDYTDVSWTVYQKVVRANVVTENDTQTDIEAAIKNIEAAQAKLVRAGDLTEYQAVIDSAKKADYTAASWTAYKKVLEANEVTRKNTQAEIDAATANILAAQIKLLKSAGDMEEYLDALAQAEEDNYTTASWAVYKKVLDANEVTPASGQTAIDAATAKILVAQKSLVPVGEMEKYLAALAAVVKTDYTTASWATYMKVVDANEVNRYSGQTVIDAATAKIKAAQKNLVKGGVMTAYNTLLAAYPEASANLYTSKTWAAYQKVLDANVMTADKGQAAIDAAIVKIKAAQKTLVLRGSTVKYEAAYAAKLEAEYTPVTWAVYQKVLDANELVIDADTHTNDNPQAVIDAATKKITDAQKKLVYRAGISIYQKYKTLVESVSVNKDIYTKISWAAYKKIADANIMTPEKSEAEIITAMGKIETAQESLVKKGITTTYDLEYTEFDGKEPEYTTFGWTAYQKVLDNKINIMTVENSQAEIDAATKRIIEAQKKLAGYKAPAELKYYTEAIADYAGRKAEFKPDSWLIYQKVITDNYVDKDSTSSAILAATQNILTAQKQLASNADLTGFLDAIELYRQYQLLLGTDKDFSGHVTDASWDAYAVKVQEYASFDKAKNWQWDQYGKKPTDITQASGEAAVNGATNTLNNLKAAFVYRDDVGHEYKQAYDAYDKAMMLPADTTPESFTTSSYGLYMVDKNLNTILPEDRIKTDLAVIIKKTGYMVTAIKQLVPRASKANVALFVAEKDAYEFKLNNEMYYDKATSKYIADKCLYTLASWEPYEAAYKKYTITLDTKLYPEDDVDKTFTDATQELAALRAALKSTTATPTAPVIATASTIANGAANPTVTVTGTNFKAGMTAADLTVDAGTTGLTLGTVNRVSATQVTVAFTGTAAAGNATIQAKTSAFDPAGVSASNTLTVTVPATAPVIATASTIANGAANPTVTVTGTNFKAGMTAADLTVDAGTTGLTLGTVNRVSATEVTIAFTGTAAAGNVTIQAKTSAFDPAGVSASNTLTVTVPATAPVIATASTIASGAANPTVTVTGTNFKAGMTAADLTVDAGTTGLTLGTVNRVSATEVTIAFTGTAAAGNVTIQAKTSAFDPAGVSASNTLTVTVPATAPVIATASTIASGAANPTVTVTGTNFKAGMTAADLTVDAGTTGLTLGTVNRVSATEVTIAFTGTAAAGNVTIQAKTSAFDPAGVSASNTLTVTV
ncbi:hypothetical protein [Acetobacterium malicum]|uniref:hypothetical protein n=1 Tax=Acetobacterium malicum TaxID=52692 RepID=UPI0039BFA1F7